MSDDALNRRDLIKLGGLASGAALLTSVGPGAAIAADTKVPQVPRKRLGKTNVEVPILMMGGSMAVDIKFDVKYAEGLRFGVDYFDSSRVYVGGNSEIAIRNTLTKLKARERAWITTKTKAHDPKGAEASLAESLRQLQTNRVEGFFLHGLDDPDALTPELGKLVARLKKEGRIRHFGFSCHGKNVAELLQRAAKTPWIEIVMFRYNFRDYGKKPLNDAIDAAAKADVGLIAMKTQGSEVSFADAWKKFEKTGRWNKHQAVLKAVWADERITGAVSEMDSLDKVRQNVAAALDRSELGAADRESLERYAEATRALSCDGCDHLCSANVTAPVRIGDTMRCLMYHDVYGKPDAARIEFATLPAEARRLRNVDFSRAECPYGVDVRGAMRRAADLFEGPG